MSLCWSRDLKRPEGIQPGRDGMNTAPRNVSLHPNAADPSANEQLILQMLRMLPAESLFRVLQSLPPEWLKAALEARQAAAVAAAAVAAAPPAPAQVQQLAVPPAVQPAAAANPADKRRSPRHRTLRGAKIIYNNRMSTVDAQVRDISETGCRLRVSTAAHLPASFFLAVTGMPGERRCEVRWRNDSELGVQFVT